MSRAMALAELLPDVEVPRGLVVHGLVQDSRAVQAGDAFSQRVVQFLLTA